jgi:hypothetical protein
MARTYTPYRRMTLPPGILFTVAFFTATLTMAVSAGYMPIDDRSTQDAPNGVMIILRGIASPERPRGQLDDSSAAEYAQRLGYEGEVLDVAADRGHAQVRQALDRIHNDATVTAIYGFSGGGYNAKRIWAELSAAERQRIGKVVVIGAPGVSKADFPGSAEVIVRRDPPAGHMAGPKVLLQSLDPG